MPMAKSVEPNILRAALEGLEIQRRRLEEYIANVRRALGGVSAFPIPLPRPVHRRRKLSAAARAGIAAAQKRRWAEYQKKKAGSVKAKGKK